jgi:hypothetical protein
MEPSEMRTPDLVREFVQIKQQDVRNAFKGVKSTSSEHSRLGAVVNELRSRGVLD